MEDSRFKVQERRFRGYERTVRERHVRSESSDGAAVAEGGRVSEDAVRGHEAAPGHENGPPFNVTAGEEGDPLEGERASFGDLKVAR